jgi:hypothetical protein
MQNELGSKLRATLTWGEVEGSTQLGGVTLPLTVQDTIRAWVNVDVFCAVGFGNSANRAWANLECCTTICVGAWRVNFLKWITARRNFQLVYVISTLTQAGLA